MSLHGHKQGEGPKMELVLSALPHPAPLTGSCYCPGTEHFLGRVISVCLATRDHVLWLIQLCCGCGRELLGRGLGVLRPSVLWLKDVVDRLAYARWARASLTVRWTQGQQRMRSSGRPTCPGISLSCCVRYSVFQDVAWRGNGSSPGPS